MSESVLQGRPEPIASAQYSWDGEPTLVQTIVETIASASGRNFEDLPPLHNVVDVDALETIFGPRADGQLRPVTGAISFEYADYEVTVEGHGRVLVRRAA